MKRTRCALRAPLCAWALACASVALPALAAGQPPAAVLASAAPVASSYLPPDAAVEAALQAQPGVRAAAARLEAAVARVIKEGKVRTYDMGGKDSTLDVARAIAQYAG